MIFYFADRSMNILGCAGTEVDKNYHVIDDDKQEDVENGSAILQFTMIFKDDYEADARSLTNAGNYVLLKRNRKDECYTIIYSELDKSEHSIDVYAEDAGMELINQVAPKFNHHSAFDDALANKGLKDYIPGVAAASDKWEVATYNTGEDSIIDVSALADKCYGKNGEEATAANWYIHIAYANKNKYGDVIDFSTTDSTNRKYFGNYKNTTAAGSTNPDDYSWSQAKGDATGTTKIHIAYGDQDKHGNVYNFTTQYSLNNFRGYVGGALTTATTTQTSTETHSSDNKVLKVGDTVRIAAGARDMNYNCTFASWVYQRDYTVLEVRGNRIVFGWSNGAITGVTDAGHIIGGSTTTTTTTTTTVNTPAPTDAGSYGWTSVTNKGTSSAVGVTERFTCSTGEDIGNNKHSLKTNYTNYLRTYYYFNQQTRVVTQYTSDDASSLYVNGELCVTNDGSDISQTSVTGKTAYMYFNKGWNIVEIVLHQVTGPCWFKFSNNPRSDSHCSAQNTTSDFLDPHSVEWYFNEFAGTSGFEIGTNELSGYSQRLYWDGEDTATSRLLSVATAFNGEMCYSFEIDHMQLHHMYVNFYKKRGTETDITLRFPKEVSNIRVKTSVENLATGLYATGDTIDDQNHELTLYGYSYDDGDVYVDSDGILKSRTALQTYHRYQINNSSGEIVKTFTYKTKSQQELFRRAFNELSTASKPEINYEVDIQIPSEDISIGDTIRVVDEKGGIYLRARVVKLERKIYADELIITLGDYLIEESKISKDLKALAEQFRVYVATAKTYTWFVYADDPSGTNISLNPYDTTTDGDNTIYTFRKYVGIAYNMPSPSVNLSNPEIFQWSLIKGENGIPGQKGNDGKTYYFHVAYANKADNGTIIDFSVDDPTGRSYIGTYTDTNESDATVSTAYKWQLVKGKDGESSIAHIAYCNKDDNGNITDFSTSTNQNRKWIGVAVDYNDTAPTDATKYTWAKYIGDDGYSPEVSVSKYGGVATITVKGKDGVVTTTTVADGKDGTSIKGDKGDTAYVHIAYATSSDGSTGFNTSWFSGATYIGIKSDNTKEDPTSASSYEWSLIKGADGKNGKDGHSPVVAATKSGDTTTITVDGKEQAVIKDGISVRTSSNSITYQVGTSPTTAPTGTWSATVPTVPEGQYLWSKTVVVYTDGASTTTYSVARQGVTGPKGDKGDSITITSSSTTYATSTSSTQPADSEFTSTSIPTLAAGDYLWTKVVTNFSDGKSVKSYSVSRIGADGKTGATGANGKTTHWAYATSADGKTGFSTIMFSGATYVGTYDDTNQADSTDYTKYKWTKLKGDTGAKGADGKGIKSTSVTYQASSSQTTAPSGTWATSVPTLSANNPYLWTRTIITYTDNATSTSYSVSSTLKGIEIGGRNLHKHSDTIDSAWVTANGTNNNGTVTLTKTSYLTRIYQPPTNGYWSWEPNTTYTASIEAKGNSGGEALWLTCNGGGTVDYKTSNPKLTTSWKRYSRTFTTGGSVSTGSMTYESATNNSTIQVRKPKLEKGNTATDWTPAPEDVDAVINSTIIKHEQEYYLSTSDTSLAGGSWSTTFPARKDGTFYWVRYKDTHANNAVTYDPSANGKLLTEVNEVWNSVVNNQTAINSSNAQINMVATSVTSVKNDLSKKADTDDVKSSMDGMSSTIADINKQVAELKVKANSIEASVTDVNNLAQTTKKATAALTANGLSVDTGQTTKSVVDGTGLTITSKADNSVVAKFTTGESEIQNLKIDGFMKLGAHVVQKMQDTEWDGTTVNGTGWMWNGG